jgi:hemerythrin-like domain-containing protein
MVTFGNASPNAADLLLTHFSNCHAGIITHLNTLGKLADLAMVTERARQAANDTCHFFRDVIYSHHADEERVLFDAVLTHALEGDEQARVKAITDHLTCEHRQVESMVSDLTPALTRMAAGKDCQLDVAAIGALVDVYGAHARVEETQFLPLAQTILRRGGQHLAELGLSLHARHVALTAAHF